MSLNARRHNRVRPRERVANNYAPSVGWIEPKEESKKEYSQLVVDCFDQLQLKKDCIKLLEPIQGYRSIGCLSSTYVGMSIKTSPYILRKDMFSLWGTGTFLWLQEEGGYCHREDCGEFEGKMYVISWLLESTIICRQCGDRCRIDDSFTMEEEFCSRSCAVAFGYGYCHNCGEFEYLGSSRWCDRCSESEDDEEEDSWGALHPYSYKPSPEFYGDAPYFGFEIETNGGGERFARDLADDESMECFYCKEDGSLDSSTGVEIVSHPIGRGYMPTFFDTLKRMHTIASNNGASTDRSCGVHIHISRTAMSKF